MNNIKKIILFLSLVFLGVSVVYSQKVTIKPDSVQNNTNRKNETRKQKRYGQNTDGSDAIKQVNSARPDMTKARGARPPDIVRPSGSGIPRGMGKPGGARRRGGL
jgi:hypothetical protein